MKNLIYIFIFFSFNTYSQKNVHFYCNRVDIGNIEKNTFETQNGNYLIKTDDSLKIITVAFKNAETGKSQISRRQYYNSYVKDGNKGYNIKDEAGTAIILINFNKSEINYVDATAKILYIFHYFEFEDK